MTEPTKDVAVHKSRVPLTGPQSDLDGAYRYAKALSLSGLLPEGLRGKVNDILVTLLYGQELGVPPMQAVQSIYVVKGRPTLSANLWVALARKAGHKVRVAEETAESCTVEIERADDVGHPTRVTYTLDQARTAGLLSNKVWSAHTAAMLYARAVSTACRRACPEVAMGFSDEYELAEPEPTVDEGLKRVVAEREQRAAEEARPAEDPAEVAAELARLDQGRAAEHIAEVVDDDPTLPDDPDLTARDEENQQ